MTILDATPNELQDFLDALKSIDEYKGIYEEVMTRHFDEYRDSKTPVIDSYNDDPDDFWDARLTLNAMICSGKLHKI